MKFFTILTLLLISIHSYGEDCSVEKIELSERALLLETVVQDLQTYPNSILSAVISRITHGTPRVLVRGRLEGNLSARAGRYHDYRRARLTSNMKPLKPLDNYSCPDNKAVVSKIKLLESCAGELYREITELDTHEIDFREYFGPNGPTLSSHDLPKVKCSE